MLAITRSAVVRGIEGAPVTVEVHVGNGLPAFCVVGRPDPSCRESRDRVRAALVNSGFRWPDTRITVNLAPGGVPKVGAGLDLAIAMGVLVAGGEVPSDAVTDIGFVAELGLDGSLRPVVGALPLVAAVESATVVVAPGNQVEAGLAPGRTSRPVTDLAALVAALGGTREWPAPPPAPTSPPPLPPPDLAEVRGQAVARRALEVAAAGGHHLLLVGPPGSGKTMLARRLPSLLPRLDDHTAFVASCVRSAAGLGDDGLVRTPPFRSPHHHASAVSLIGGGGQAMRPGEVSLAHGGVLFLDEVGEFSAHAIDGLRQPLEEGAVRVSRAHASRRFPARFLLVAAMNPCACGAGAAPGRCRCSARARARYRRRLSGPVLDRLDLRVTVEAATPDELLSGTAGESSAAVAVRVERARAVAANRGFGVNATLGASALDEVAPVPPDARQLLERALGDGRLSGRGLHRVRAVARTIADLADADTVAAEHVAEALAHRRTVFTDGFEGRP